VADGAAGLFRRLAGHGDDLDDLLGAERGRPAGPWGVIESLLDQGKQTRLGGPFLLGVPEGGGSDEPTVAPVADGETGEAEPPGDRRDGFVGVQRQKDGNAAGQPPWGGLALLEALEQGALALGQSDGGGGRTGHEAPTSRVFDLQTLAYSIPPPPIRSATPVSLY
jgi:hypothetical protein